MPNENNPQANAILGHTFRLLDHGFVRLIDYMGGDAEIEQAARVSYDAGAASRKVSETRGLLRYLLRHRHTTPFEMCELKFHCKMPIFVARQWIRHRTASVNELSGRYSVLPTEFYLPGVENLKYQSKTNKQGRAEPLPYDLADTVRSSMRKQAQGNFAAYQLFLGECPPDDYFDEEDTARLRGGGGLAKELARISLPLSTYTEWYWKIDLHNLMHFLKLRLDPHAQHEIRVFADVMFDLARRVAPLAMEAFEDYVLNAVTFSKPDIMAGAIDNADLPEGERKERLKAIFGNDREVQEYLEKVSRMEKLVETES